MCRLSDGRAKGGVFNTFKVYTDMDFNFFCTEISSCVNSIFYEVLKVFGLKEQVFDVPV